jgi:drug/metabolite transporter (DMT)-like permease
MTSKHRLDLLGNLGLVGSILGWSLMPVMLKGFTDDMDGWTTNGVRYPFAALLWLGPLIYQVRQGRVNPAIWKMALLPTGVNLGAQILWAQLPYFIDATQMAFLARISVAFAITGGFLFFPDERRLMKRPTFWVGVALSIAGFVAMSLGGLKPLEGRELVGVFLVLLCGGFYGLYGVAVRYSMRGSRPWVAFPVISLYTSAVLIVCMFLFGEPERLLETTAVNFGLLLISAVIGIAVAHTCFYIAIEHLGVAISSGMQLVGPFLTYLWAFLFFGESLTLSQIVGGVVLLGGAALLLRAQRKTVPASIDPSKAPIEPKLPD